MDMRTLKIVVANKIRKRRRLEEELRKVNEEIEELNREIKEIEMRGGGEK